MYNIYDTYDEYNFNYCYPYTFDARNKSYLEDKYAPVGSWNYGDNIIIRFHLTGSNGEPLEPEDFEDRFVKIKFYNFRFEQLNYELEFTAQEYIEVNISYEDSEKYFQRGIVYCSMDIISYNEEEIYDVSTILPRETCMFYIK